MCEFFRWVIFFHHKKITGLATLPVAVKCAPTACQKSLWREIVGSRGLQTLDFSAFAVLPKVWSPADDGLAVQRSTPLTGLVSLSAKKSSTRDSPKSVKFRFTPSVHLLVRAEPLRLRFCTLPWTAPPRPGVLAASWALVIKEVEAWKEIVNATRHTHARTHVDI